MTLPEEYNFLIRISNYTYDENLTINYVFKNNTLTSSQKTYYNDDNQIIEIQSYGDSSRGYSKVPYLTEKYSYDESGNIILYEYIPPYAPLVKEYHYDENGQLVKVDLSSSGKFDGKSVFFNYDENGNKISVIDEALTESISFYQYDKQGNLLVSRTLNLDDNTLRGMHVYSYDDLGNKQSEQKFDKMGKLEKIIKWKYFPDGKIQNQFTTNFKNNRTTEIELRYEYDKYGSQVMTKLYNFVESSKEIRTYDKNGNKIGYKKFNTKQDILEEWASWNYDHDELIETKNWKKAFLDNHILLSNMKN